MTTFNNGITRLANKSVIALNIMAFIFAFVCYFCMYSFRKPFTAAKYTNAPKIFYVDYKIMCVTLQCIGYTISKFAGIKIISELGQKWRGLLIIIFIFIAEVALILFGAIPAPYNAIAIFINGLPLGMIWGLVFSYLEGRRFSEILGTGMCISFIISSGIVKTVGKALMKAAVPEYWMPATTGAIFFLPLLASVFCLESIPEPSEDDVSLRSERVVMTGKDRWEFCKTFAPGMISMTVFYMFLSAYRDFRDNFALELWESFGFPDTPSIFSTTEIIVAFVVVIPIALFVLIKSNLYTLVAYHILILFGMVLLLICTFFAHGGKMPGLYYMVITGIGLYLSYVPFNSIIFDLFIATFKYPANSGFLMYVCDSFGYLASIVTLFIKNFATPNIEWQGFFFVISYIMAALGIVLMALSLIYYIYKYKTYNRVHNLEEENNEPGEEDEEVKVDTNQDPSAEEELKEETD